ncbi:MAG: methyltransferase domain-containing protein [Desulfatirhabdiaceae bacterium]
MTIQISQDDLKKIGAGIRDKYIKVADNPEGLFKYPTGRTGIEAQKYDPKLVSALPEAVISSYCGVGNPFSLGPINKGDIVLDIGCGAGVDTILAAMMTYPTGKAVGIDIVPEMVQRATSNFEMTDFKNISFISTSGDVLPFEDSEFDVVISNGVINLIPDKDTLLKEVLRVLKPGGRLMIADQIAIGSIQKDLKARLANWFQ